MVAADYVMEIGGYLTVIALIIGICGCADDVPAQQQCCSPGQLLNLELLQCYEDDDLGSSNRTELFISCLSGESIKAVPLQEFNQTDQVLFCAHGSTFFR